LNWICFFFYGKVKIATAIYEIDHLYPSLHFGIKNAPAVILRDHKYPQELTPQIFVDVASHVGLILPPKRCQLGFTTKELAATTVATKDQKIVTKSF